VRVLGLSPRTGALGAETGVEFDITIASRDRVDRRVGHLRELLAQEVEQASALSGSKPPSAVSSPIEPIARFRPRPARDDLVALLEADVNSFW